MYISTKDWKNYIDKMRALNEKAADAIVNYVQKNGFENTDELVGFANSVVQKYGGGSAALAAAMYDATAEASGQFYDPAEPAPLPEYGEVAKTVHGTLKRSRNVNELGGAVSRLVKRAGADTTLLNAYRDRPKYGKKRNTGAQVAWVPMGDTCPFCLMLASNGWRNQTVGGAEHHAKHIHANCDCNYAVRFDNHSGVQGYDPDKYKEMFDNVEGDTWSQKVNSMRRENYEKNKDQINARKRENYAERNRKINFGTPKSFEREKTTVVARLAKKYANNNLYISDDVELSPKEIRWINNSITTSKSLLNISDECNIPIIVVNDEDNLAGYNPRTNILYVSSMMSNKKTVLEKQRGFAAANEEDSTMVHELIHWKDAEEYRKRGNIIESAEPKSKYSVYQRNRAIEELTNQGINIANIDDIMDISEYSYRKMLENDFEEVYTELRTKRVFER